ncbi:hypothetical protein C1646_777548 [Rhizophagus diaphanus]|nr:hypothetical protein C1646_777548 [Rhizophagus diaphanus] [Rhizophagus sp. MUCL 43196]
MSNIFFSSVHKTLATFITNGFLQMIFSKSSDSTLNKATLLITTFGDDKYQMAIYDHEGSVLGQLDPDLENSDNSSEDDDTNIITENTPLTFIPNPVLILQQELPTIVTGQNVKNQASISHQLVTDWHFRQISSPIRQFANF